MLQAVYLLPLLLLLAKPAPTRAWFWSPWYPLKLDLHSGECKPSSPEACGSTLGCVGYWTGLGGNRMYPAAGVMVTTTMMLVMGRPMLQRWRPQVTTHPRVTTSLSGASKRRAPISDRTLLLGVLHTLDALLLHMEGHLQRLATQQCK